MTTHAIRDHCAALNDDVAYLLACIEDGSSDLLTLREIADRAETARAALAQPEGEGPSERDVAEWINRLPLWHGASRDELPGIVLRALAHWGRPATPPAPEAGEVGLLVDRLNQVAGDFDFLCNKIVNGECRTLACLRRGGYDDGPCRARGIKPPDPSVATCPALEKAGAMRRAATLLQQLSAPAPVGVPVAVSERLPDSRSESEGGDCDAEGRCWIHQPHPADPEAPEWKLARAKYASASYGTICWRPASAIPMPQGGEVPHA